MKKLGEVLQRTDKEKYEFFKQSIQHRIEQAESYSKGILIGSDMPVDMINAKDLIKLSQIIGYNEIQGYDCLYCGKPWWKVSFDGLMYSGEYNVPGCECYHRCPVCHTNLYEESYRGDLQRENYTCHVCGYQLMEKEGQQYRSLWRKNEIKPIMNEIEINRTVYLHNKYSKDTIKDMEESSGKSIMEFKIVNGIIIEPEIPGTKSSFEKSSAGKIK